RSQDIGEHWMVDLRPRQIRWMRRPVRTRIQPCFFDNLKQAAAGDARERPGLSVIKRTVPSTVFSVKQTRRVCFPASAGTAGGKKNDDNFIFRSKVKTGLQLKA